MTSSGPAGPAFVLASASPRRRELLAALGAPFEVVAADIEERADEAEPASLAITLAGQKARAVESRIQQEGPARLEGCPVLAADTLVVLDGRPLGKPADAAEARSMLRALRGRSHYVVTGVAVLFEAQLTTEATTTEVRMRDYADAEIDAYVARDALDDGPYDKAGAYAIQDEAFHPVEWTRGCVCSVIGLPLWPAWRALRAAGIEASPPTLGRCRTCPLAPSALRVEG